jgi:hypothetical protein
LADERFSFANGREQRLFARNYCRTESPRYRVLAEGMIDAINRGSAGTVDSS